MKKLLLLFFLFSKMVLFSQTLLNTFPLNLNNLGNTQILNVEDEKTNDIYACAWDNKTINILKYNKSLFRTGQFSDSIKNEASRNLIGCIIGQENKPTLYWISQNFKNFLITTYDMNSKKSESLNFDFPANNDYIVTYFQQKNAFYIVAKEKDLEHLLLYKFKDGNCEIKMLDFSSFTFKNENNQSFSFNLLLKRFPIKKMESDVLNPVDLASKISKLYVLDDQIILTFDYALLKTQVFQINLNSGEITEKALNLPTSKKTSKTSNSFYNDKKLFQTVANTEEFLFEIKDFDSGNTIKKYAISKNDSIPFKNSPFIMQINDEAPRQLKTTAKFLKNLDGLTAGISVLKSKKNNFITFSGFGEYSDYYYQQDAFGDFGERVPYYLSKMVYFDGVLDENMDFVKDKKVAPFAIDNLFYYLSIHKNITLFDSLKLKDYYILSYYDSGSKQFIMRKFTDGFMMEDNGNPIMNKALFSNPASFGDIKLK